MKKRILSTMLCLLLLLAHSTGAIAVSTLQPPVGNPFEEPVKIRVTCYMDKGITSTGCATRHGIIATCPEWAQEGNVLQIWAVGTDSQGNECIGDFQGYYEPLDTGYGIDTGEGTSDIFDGKTQGSIEKGWSVDVYCETQEEVQEWQALGDYFYIYIIPNCKG